MMFTPSSFGTPHAASVLSSSSSQPFHMLSNKIASHRALGQSPRLETNDRFSRASRRVASPKRTSIPKVRQTPPNDAMTTPEAVQSATSLSLSSMHRVKPTLHHRRCLSRTCFAVVLSCSTSMSNSSNANVRVAIDVFQYRLHFSCCRRGLTRTRMSPASRSGASSSSFDAVTLVERLENIKCEMLTKKCEKCPRRGRGATRRRTPWRRTSRGRR